MTTDFSSREFASQVQALAQELELYVVGKRRFFHAHPELSAHEAKTTAALFRELESLGVPCMRPQEFLVWQQERQRAWGRDAAQEAPATCPSSQYSLNPEIDPLSGLVALIRGEAPDAYDDQGKPRRCIVLRADIDALPVKEETGLPFASQNEGVMHACGHDCHMAMMLGAVRMLHELRHQLRGEVRIVFQPAEEISIGSRHMIAAGVLDGADGIYGAHIWSEVEAGTVSAEPGPRMANTDWFRVDVSGSSAHGAMPHKGVDAIVVGAAIIEALQVVVSRDVSPFEPVVLTIGEFHGGVARNVMAGTSYLTGTVRSFNPEVRQFLRDRMKFMVNHVAQSYSAKATFEWETGNSALINDKASARRAIKSAVRVLGEDALAHYEGTLSGEDFSEYLNFVPGVFAFIGGGNPAVGADHPQHSCYYNVDESVLIKGSLMATQYAFDFLNE